MLQVGATAKQKNAITAGSYVVENPVVIGMDGLGMDVEANVRTRSFFGKVKKAWWILQRSLFQLLANQLMPILRTNVQTGGGEMVESLGSVD